MSEEWEYSQSAAAKSEYEKSGYLLEDFKLFHLKDTTEHAYAYHYHEFHKILWFVEGKAEYHIEGKAYQLEPYDIVAVEKGQIHKPEVDYRIPYERYVLYISDGFLGEHSGEGYDLKECFVGAGRESSSVIRLGASDSNHLLAVLQKLEENENMPSYAGKLYSNILFLEFLIELNRICIEKPGVYHKTARYDKKVVEIVQYINDNLARELSIDRLSEQFYLSKYHMMRKFKEETGYSVHQYILEKRILLAREMLMKGIPATTACMECGFQDYSTFTRAFKNKLHVLPSEIGI